MEEQYDGGCYTATYPPGFFARYGRSAFLSYKHNLNYVSYKEMKLFLYAS